MELRLDQPRYKEQAGLIRKAADHLNALLTEILDLAKVEAGAMPHLPTEQNVADIVQSTADFFAVTAANKNLDMQVQIAPDAPATLVCDGLRLKQVLNNLLSNAMKFTETGTVTIEVDATADAVRFHVVDTGPGIPAHLHEAIFEKFRQGNDQVSYQHGGTGLGLALSRALAVLMGARSRCPPRRARGRASHSLCPIARALSLSKQYRSEATRTPQGPRGPAHYGVRGSVSAAQRPTQQNHRHQPHSHQRQ